MSTTDKTYQQDVTKLITNYSQSEEHLVAFSLSLSASTLLSHSPNKREQN